MSTEPPRRLPVRNPRTGEIDLHITPPTGDELRAICAKLREAQRAWARRPLAERIKVMSAWANDIQKNHVAIADADCTDTGYSHTSRASPHIVALSIRGWCEDVTSILERAQVTGASPVMPTVPVIPVMKYRRDDEAIALANDTEFGLSAAVIAGDAGEAERRAEQIDAGAISVQDTFLTFAKLRKIGTNSFKHSGLGGSRTGPDSILRFLRKKAILTNTAPPASITDPPTR